MSTCIVCSAAQQEPQFSMAAAVAVRGDTELSPAEALASAEARVDEHIRRVWRDRAQRAAERHRPFWMPELLTEGAVQSWLADLPVEQLIARVDREDRERVHEFGNSYQTTLWIAEKPELVERGERRLRAELRRLERTTAVKAGGVAAGWVVLALILAWIDRLSRGYMTGRLRAIGVLGGVLMPAALFLV
ncbi:MAG: hypothetical protein KAI24_22790 [Planctomycetes bacterium]|nr:hypothetical protein [Planctomycetota bacterium]